MRKTIFALSLLAAAAAVPAQAETPVERWELGQFVGAPLHGAGFVPLGIVGGYNERLGIIQVVGPGGTVANIHTSMLFASGRSSLQAPLLNKGDIAAASSPGRSGDVYVAPSITIENPYNYEVPRYTP